MLKKRLLVPGLTIILLLVIGLSIYREVQNQRIQLSRREKDVLDLTRSPYPASYNSDVPSGNPASLNDVHAWSISRNELMSAPADTPFMSPRKSVQEPDKKEMDEKIARLKELVDVNFNAEDSNLSQEVRATRYTVGVGLYLTDRSVLGVEAQKEFNDSNEAEYASTVPSTEEAMRVKYQIKF